jgi:hypothetical protein
LQTKDRVSYEIHPLERIFGLGFFFLSLAGVATIIGMGVYRYMN